MSRFTCRGCTRSCSLNLTIGTEATNLAGTNAVSRWCRLILWQSQDKHRTAHDPTECSSSWQKTWKEDHCDRARSPHRESRKLSATRASIGERRRHEPDVRIDSRQSYKRPRQLIIIKQRNVNSRYPHRRATIVQSYYRFDCRGLIPPEYIKTNCKRNAKRGRASTGW